MNEKNRLEEEIKRTEEALKTVRVYFYGTVFIMSLIIALFPDNETLAGLVLIVGAYFGFKYFGKVQNFKKHLSNLRKEEYQRYIDSL